MHSTRLIKFAFIFLAIGLTIFLFSQTNDNVERVEIATLGPTTPLSETTVTAETTMEAPRFSGQDNKNRKWLVTAKKATQSGTLGSEQVTLDTVQASATNSDGNELSFIANEGFFDRTTNTLSLDKGIHMEGYGFTINTKQLTTKIDEMTVTGDSHVDVVTAQGNLSAESFRVTQEGTKVSFKGSVKTQLDKEAILRAEKLDIFLNAPNANKTATDAIDKIIAEEKVIIQRQKDVAKGDKATYKPLEGEVILSGDVLFIRDENVLKGDKLVYNLRTGKANLTSAQASDGKSGEKAEPGRIKMQLVPNK